MPFLTVLRYIAAAITGYFLGCISFSNIIAQAVAKKDIRSLGSGNAGATNILRNLGLKYAFPTFIGDALKAALAAILGCIICGKGFYDFTFLSGYTCPQIFVGGIAAILGHNFPITMGFKGGKGVSCTLGLLIVMNPILGLVFVAAAAIANIFIKVYSIVSIFTVFFAAIIFTVFDANGDIYEIIALWSMFALTLFMHRENIVRIFKGTEKQVKIFDSEEK